MKQSQSHRLRIKDDFMIGLESSLSDLSSSSSINVSTIHAAKLTDRYKYFVYIISRAYDATDSINKYYPRYFSWYWQVMIPDVISGKADVIVAFVGKAVAGVSIVRKSGDIRVISAIYVKNEFRGDGVTQQLLTESFRFLGTTCPVIALDVQSVKSFDYIIKRYGWKRFGKIPSNPETGTPEKIVFNSKEYYS